MKIGGKTLRPARETVTLRDGLTIRLTAPPLGRMEELVDELGGFPEAPQIGWITREGKFVRDENGDPIPQRNEQDPAYLAATKAFGRRLLVAQFLECLDDEAVTFEAERGEQTLGEYCDAVYGEMRDAGMNDADVLRIQRAVQNLRGLRAKEMEAYADRFLPEQGSGATPSPTESETEKPAPAST